MTKEEALLELIKFLLERQGISLTDLDGEIDLWDNRGHILRINYIAKDAASDSHS